MHEIRTIILQTAPRLLGFLDRSPESITYGCCDRYYWHYKLHDMSNARFQEMALFLAMIYNIDFEGNIYFKQHKVREWALACIRFWVKLIHRDGYVSEVYPFERSYCATAFSTLAVFEALALLSQCDKESQQMVAALIDGLEVNKKVRNVGHWLIRNFKSEVTNQMAAAAAALDLLALREKTFGPPSADFIRKVMEDYSKNGFYQEYGGDDIGYASITNSVLVVYMEKASAREGLRQVIGDSSRRMDCAISDDGLYDVSAKSRKTQFLYPYGFWAMRSPVFDKIINGIKKNSIITPLWMDDRYCTGLAIDYLRTYKNYCDLKKNQL